MSFLPHSPFTPNPASVPSSTLGQGLISLHLLPPNTPVLHPFLFHYPLKLISPAPHISLSGHPISLIFLLTYGGGLVAGDWINLKISVGEKARLVLVTQGSTKIFKTPSRGLVSGQALDVTVRRRGALCYLPDPVQPFGESCYEQVQTFRVEGFGGESNGGGDGGGLCVLDWVSEGRTARGEKWDLWSWRSRNEVREFVEREGKDGERKEGKLLLRDALILSDQSLSTVSGLGEGTDGMGVFGTLILYGPMFEGLKAHFLQEFKAMPRIGGKNWTADGKTHRVERSESQSWREQRQEQESTDGLLWTAAELRGFVVVKFGARAVEGGRGWLRNMIRKEGSVEREFGPQSLLCIG
ncbi:MAG: hypothetical protein Q9227_002720 [Pyrenula ochraceoflavens]